MPAGEREPTKTERLGLRASAAQRALLEAASSAEGTTMTDFVLRAATRAAEDVLADRRMFRLDPGAWAEFEKALDQPARDLPALRKLLETPTVLDRNVT